MRRFRVQVKRRFISLSRRPVRSRSKAQAGALRVGFNGNFPLRGKDGAFLAGASLQNSRIASA